MIAVGIRPIELVWWHCWTLITYQVVGKSSVISCETLSILKMCIYLHLPKSFLLYGRKWCKLWRQNSRNRAVQLHAEFELMPRIIYVWKWEQLQAPYGSPPQTQTGEVSRFLCWLIVIYIVLPYFMHKLWEKCDIFDRTFYSVQCHQN